MTDQGNLISLVSWTAQATYSPRVDADECSICKEFLTLCCPECQDNKKTVCNASIGKCGHCFHYHCIKRWTNEGGGFCPIDKSVWRFECEDCSFSDWKQLVKSSDKLQKKDLKSKSKGKSKNKIAIITNDYDDLPPLNDISEITPDPNLGYTFGLTFATQQPSRQIFESRSLIQVDSSSIESRDDQLLRLNGTTALVGAPVPSRIQENFERSPRIALPLSTNILNINLPGIEQQNPVRSTQFDQPREDQLDRNPILFEEDN